MAITINFPASPTSGDLYTAAGRTWKYSGVAWDLQAGASAGRELLTADRTYYVRTDGSDSNDGSANTSGAAFLTIQKAIDIAAGLDMGIYNININIANGTYSENIIFKAPVGAGILSLIGNVGTPSSVLISGTGNKIEANSPGKFHVAGMKLTTSSGAGIRALRGCIMTYASIDFGTCSGPHMYIANALLHALGDWTITGSAQHHVYANEGGEYVAESRTVTLTGTPNFPAAFATSIMTSLVYFANMTFAGSATGTRYVVNTNGIIQTFGNAASYLPGSIAGVVATGGLYV